MGVCSAEEKRHRSKVLMLQLFPLKPLLQKWTASRVSGGICTVHNFSPAQRGGESYGLAFTQFLAQHLTMCGQQCELQGDGMCVFQWKTDVAPSLRCVGVTCTDFRTCCPIWPNSALTYVPVVASKRPVGEVTPRTRNCTYLPEHHD